MHLGILGWRDGIRNRIFVLVALEPLTFERADWVTMPANCNLRFCSDVDGKLH